MLRHFLLGTVVALAIVGVAHSTVITSVDLVDPSDGIGMPPLGRAAVDVMVDMTSPGDEWYSAGIRADAEKGASFVYRIGTNGLPNLRNPNFGNPPENRTIWATSVSDPQQRSAADSRFTYASCGIAGGYSPTHPPPATATPRTLNVAWFQNHKHGYYDGAVGRIVFNLPDGVSADQLQLSLGRGPVPGMVLVRSAGLAPITPGTGNASLIHPSVTGIDWIVWVPEPSSLVLLVLGAIAFVRRG